MASNDDGSGMMAAGAYSGDAAVMDERTGELLYVLQGQKGGITQVHPILFHPSTLPVPVFLLSYQPTGLDMLQQSHSHSF